MLSDNRESSRKQRDFFELPMGAPLIAPEALKLELRPEMAEGLAHFKHRWPSFL